MDVHFPNESVEYREAREQLTLKEVELRRAIESVAEARRALPRGGAIREDYVFEGIDVDGAPEKVRLSQLFQQRESSLVVYNFMFPRDPGDDRTAGSGISSRRLQLLETPCPSCTALLDQLDGAARHAAQKLNFVVIAKTSAANLAAFAKERGWTHLRLLSTAGNSFKRDYLAETVDGAQRPMLTVFERSNGEIRHFWSSELLYAPRDAGQDPRHVGMLEPLWNLFDFLREGRPSGWEEQISY